ncbi:unnamed protein product [Cunninghamella echinulata]
MAISFIEIKFIGKSFTLWPQGLGSGRNTKFSHEKKIHEQHLILQNWLPNHNNNNSNSHSPLLLSAASSRSSSTSSLQSTLTNNNNNNIDHYFGTHNINNNNSNNNSNKNNNNSNSGTLPAGLHRWPFEFILSNKLPETIEDEIGKVFYYMIGKIHRPGSIQSHLRCRRNILVLRTPIWSDVALISNSLPTTSIISDRHFSACDLNICVEKSMASSGTLFPVHLGIVPHMKHVFLESFSVLITESRTYRLPEFDALHNEVYDFKMKLLSITNLNDTFSSSPSSPSSFSSSLSSTYVLENNDHHGSSENNDNMDDENLLLLKRAVFTKNAHLPLTGDPFHYKLNFNLPNCIDLNHSSTFHEIDIKHYLKIAIHLSTPEGPLTTHLETKITVLDCRLKEDYTVLPTYESALSDQTVSNEDVDQDDGDHSNSNNKNAFFLCPCYLDYKKKRGVSSKNEWIMMRNNNNNNNINRNNNNNNNNNNNQPPSYDDTILKYGPFRK